MTTETHSPVVIKFKKPRVTCFEMIECEVTFDDDYFHLSKVGVHNYHNAYDADENFTLFRADAVFTCSVGCQLVVDTGVRYTRMYQYRWFDTWSGQFIPNA